MTSELRPGDRVRVVGLWQLTSSLSKVGTLGVVKDSDGRRNYGGHRITLVEEIEGRLLWHRNCDLEPVLTDLELLEQAVACLAHELLEEHKRSNMEDFF